MKSSAKASAVIFTVPRLKSISLAMDARPESRTKLNKIGDNGSPCLTPFDTVKACEFCLQNLRKVPLRTYIPRIKSTKRRLRPTRRIAEVMESWDTGRTPLINRATPDRIPFTTSGSPGVWRRVREDSRSHCHTAGKRAVWHPPETFFPAFRQEFDGSAEERPTRWISDGNSKASRVPFFSPQRLCGKL